MCTFFLWHADLPTVRAVAAKGIPRRTPAQKREIGAFVTRLYELSGSPTVVEFAGRAGLYGSNVGEYMKGTAMPDGYTLMRLLKSLDYELRARGEVVDLGEPQAPRDRPVKLQEAVDDLLRWQPTVAAELDELRSRLERLESARGHQRKTHRRRATGTDGV